MTSLKITGKNEIYQEAKLRQKYYILLWKHYLLLNWMLEMNLSMNLTLPTMAFPTFFPDWLGDPTDNATACDILQSNSYAQKLKHLVRFS